MAGPSHSCQFSAAGSQLSATGRATLRPSLSFTGYHTAGIVLCEQKYVQLTILCTQVLTVKGVRAAFSSRRRECGRDEWGHRGLDGPEAKLSGSAATIAARVGCAQRLGATWKTRAGQASPMNCRTRHLRVLWRRHAWSRGWASSRSGRVLADVGGARLNWRSRTSWSVCSMVIDRRVAGVSHWWNCSW